MGLGGVGADDEEHLGLGEIGKAVGHGPGAECCRQTGDGGGVSGSGAVVDVVGADHRAEELLHLVGVFVDAAGAATPAMASGPCSAF